VNGHKLEIICSARSVSTGHATANERPVSMGIETNVLVNLRHPLLDIFEMYPLLLKAESPGGPLHLVDEDEDEGGDPAHQGSVTHTLSLSIFLNLSTFSVHLNYSA
jgi:hypothetical protein